MPINLAKQVSFLFVF